MPMPPTLEEQRRHYDEWNAAHRSEDLDHIGPESRARALALLEAVRALPGPPRRILEVGCGTGWLTEHLTRLGDVTGIDLSPRAVALARARGLRAELRSGDFLREPLPEAGFDVVVCMDTIFYVYDQVAFVDRLAAMLRPGGHLVLDAINPFVYERWSVVGPPAPGQVRRWLDRRSLQRLLERRFEVLATRTVLPRGDTGVLRLVNSVKLNRALEAVLDRERIARAKEWLGLGHARLFVARLRP